MTQRVFRAQALVVALVATAHAGPTAPKAQQQLARDIYKELVETNTTESSGDTLKAAKAMAARLVAAGLPDADVKVIATADKRGNLIARLRGTGKRKPIMLMAHLDVVEAKREDWSMDPFQLIDKDGWFYGRGTNDDKSMVAVWVAAMIRFKQEKYQPDRDLILVLETDEEIADTKAVGIKYLLAHHRDLLDAEFALNEGGDVAIRDGKPVWNSLNAAEKVFQTFTLETKNTGGHSSQPRKDNAIYELAQALVKLEAYQFPFELNSTTRAYFEAMSKVEKGQLAEDMRSALSAKPDAQAIARLSATPAYNAQLRTTCVATRLAAGHADNALPQLAHATVNCRILPGHTSEEVQRTLEQVIGDPKLVITVVGSHEAGGAPSVPPPELLTAIQTLSAKFWPGTPVVPWMSTGASDGRFLREAGIPCFGHSGLAYDLLDLRIHGKDERVAKQAFFESQEYLYELVHSLAGGK
jgi:acetylornithine deacetylase/succinyl-diaminopimelate desuccinylase-like protein